MRTQCLPRARCRTVLGSGHTGLEILQDLEEDRCEEFCKLYVQHWWHLVEATLSGETKGVFYTPKAANPASQAGNLTLRYENAQSESVLCDGAQKGANSGKIVLFSS